MRNKITGSKLQAMVAFWLIVLPVAFYLGPSVVFASTLSITPASQTVQLGSEVTVQVKLNTAGDSVNALSLGLTYPADKLDLLTDKASFNSQAFPVRANQSLGNGSIRLDLGSFSGVSGDVNVVQLTFKAKNNGQAQFAFTSDSAAPRTSDSSNSLDVGSSRGGTVNIGDIGVNKEITQNNQQGSVLVPSSTPKNYQTTNQICQSKEQAIKDKLSYLVTLVESFITRLNTINSLLAGYYKDKLAPAGKTISDFDLQQQNIQAKKSALSNELSNLKNKVNDFSCGSDAQQQLIKIHDAA